MASINQKKDLHCLQVVLFLRVLVKQLYLSGVVGIEKNVAVRSEIVALGVKVNLKEAWRAPYENIHCGMVWDAKRRSSKQEQSKRE
jgi:hypothetical protein